MNREKEYILLEQISHENQPLRQRDLAEIAGLSLGMTNGMLKKFAEKGLLLIEKINARNVRYILTPKGWEDLNRRTKTYLKKTVKNVVNYRKSIELLVDKAIEENYSGIGLVGESDLGFILEWASHKKGILFFQLSEPTEDLYIIYAEKILRSVP